MPNAPKTPLRSIRIADELWQAVHDKAQREGVTVSDVIRCALERYIKR